MVFHAARCRSAVPVSTPSRSNSRALMVSGNPIMRLTLPGGEEPGDRGREDLGVVKPWTVPGFWHDDQPSVREPVDVFPQQARGRGGVEVATQQQYRGGEPGEALSGDGRIAERTGPAEHLLGVPIDL